MALSFALSSSPYFWCSSLVSSSCLSRSIWISSALLHFSTPRGAFPSPPPVSASRASYSSRTRCSFNFSFLASSTRICASKTFCPAVSLISASNAASLPSSPARCLSFSSVSLSRLVRVSAWALQCLSFSAMSSCSSFSFSAHSFSFFSRFSWAFLRSSKAFSRFWYSSSRSA